MPSGTGTDAGNALARGTICGTSALDDEQIKGRAEDNDHDRKQAPPGKGVAVGGSEDQHDQLPVAVAQYDRHQNSQAGAHKKATDDHSNTTNDGNYGDQRHG